MIDDPSSHFLGFAALLRQHRLAAGLTQEELAERAGTSARGVSDLERGARSHPHRETVRLLADALGLSGGARAAFVQAAPRAIGHPIARPERTAALLPVPLTPLIGRQQERAVLTSLLREEVTRLVTLTGPGGVGKTRLALQVAADLLEDFPDGAGFADLSPLNDPALVPATIATVLGVREEGGALAERVIGVISGKHLLLVLDNCERVVGAAPFVVDMLARSPHLMVLATSRTPLHAYGEQEYPLAPLPLPDLAHLLPIEHLSQNDAVRLFVARAQAVTPDFALTTANVAAVAEICSRLDGLPLAIELAAARVKVLPPRALLKRLEQRLPLLTGGARTLPARQQTMRDAIGWSHDLLSPEEQTLFRRLAVFAGGCTIDAAEAVAGAGEGLDVFAGITALVDESLLRQEGIEGEPRFRMLETVREYALEQLEASGEGDATRDRLAAWCLALIEQAQPVAFGGAMSSEWVTRLDQELPNLRTAVNWFLARGEATQAVRLLAAAEDFWTQRHLSDAELHRWLAAALAAAPDAPARDRALAHYLLSITNRLLGHDEAALHHAQRLLEAATEAADPAGLGFAHMALGFVWENRGDLAQAAAAYAEAIPLRRMADGYDGYALHAQAGLANTLILQGDLAAGVPLLEDALLRLRQLPDPPWFIVDVNNLRGFAALLQDDVLLAARLFAESLERARSLHLTMMRLGAVAGLAGVALAHGQAGRSARLLGAVEAARKSVGMKYLTWHSDRIRAQTRAALPAAAFEEAWSAGGAMPLEEAITEALVLADELKGTTPEPTA
jgi:predicted ATPase/DNA-binding XRE family transcriptional regulator